MPSVNVLSGYLVIYVSLNFEVAPVSTFSSLAYKGHQGQMICIYLATGHILHLFIIFTVRITTDSACAQCWYSVAPQGITDNRVEVSGESCQLCRDFGLLGQITSFLAEL